MASALGAASTAAAGGATASRAGSGRSSEDTGGFERMLQRHDGSEGPRAHGKAGAPAQADATRSSAPKPADTDAAEDDPALADAATDVEDNPSPDGDAASTAAPPADTALAWPPPGLAGLALSAPAADAASAATALTPPPAAVASNSASAHPLPATAAGAAPAAASGIALDADAIAADALPADIQAAVAAVSTDTDDASGEAAPTPLLHAPGALQALRGGSDITLTRAMDPTPTPVLGQDGFEEAISARVGWLAEQKIGHAHIRISPDDMGTIDVRLQMDGDKVHASFSSPHVDVRHALESSLPRLRELLGEQGFQLAHADVGQQSQGDNGPSQHGGGFTGTGTGGEADPGLAEVTLSSAQLIRQRGLLDVHA